MKIYAYNFLNSKCIKSVKEGFPLKLVVTKMVHEDKAFDKAYLLSVMPEIKWEAVIMAAVSLGLDGLPRELPDNVENNETLLRVLYKILFQTEILEGYLQCPETDTIFPICNGEPSCLLRMTEVKFPRYNGRF